ncbi:MAG: hypothetical protein KatS3mg131_3366 [Candidatus Tectimicrobiota bacterium]|nr:MAG: hypothetical protein KatS3mg131_3366 [Candidatus Tectomicrobia bacterium]
MAEEQYVTRDQHRADLAELRSELKEELAGLRQDLAVMGKSVEHLTTLVTALQNRMDQQFSELRQTQNRQLWAMIVLIAAVIVSGLLRQFVFPGGPPAP